MNVRTVLEEWVLTAESRDSAHAPPIWAPRNVQPDPYPPGESWRALGDCDQSKEKILKILTGTSLVVWWLRICLPMQEMMVGSLVATT